MAFSELPFSCKYNDKINVKDIRDLFRMKSYKLSEEKHSTIEVPMFKENGYSCISKGQKLTENRHLSGHKDNLIAFHSVKRRLPLKPDFLGA